MCHLLRALVLLSVLAAPCAGACTGATLFFSQYQDEAGADYLTPGLNKYYQIYNPTSTVINLAEEYSIATCENGCISTLDGTFEYGYKFAKGATIAAGGTYTLCNNGLEDTAGCDELLEYPRVSYSGNDLLALIWGTDHRYATASDVVDRIGRFTTDVRVPSWTVCGAASRVVATDVLLTRTADTCCGSGMTDGAFALNWAEGAVCDWTDRKSGGWVRPWARAGAPCGVALVRPPSPPAPPPLSPAQPCSSLRCDAGAQCGMCLVAIARDECRTEWHSDKMLHSCDTVAVGGFCEADGECGTSEINNCPGRDSDSEAYTGADIYRRLACVGVKPPSPPPSPPLRPPPPPMPPLSCSDPSCDAGAGCGYCLQLASERECPRLMRDGSSDLRPCDLTAAGELCEGDGECGTDQEANNCRGSETPGQPFSWRDRQHDVYRVRPCVGGAAVAGGVAGGSGGGATGLAWIACLLLVLLAVVTSLGYPLACPDSWVTSARRALRLDPTPPKSTPTGTRATIEPTSSYVAPLASNDAAAVRMPTPL